jgi:hypothetical protein
LKSGLNRYPVDLGSMDSPNYFSFTRIMDIVKHLLEVNVLVKKSKLYWGKITFEKFLSE